MHMDLVSLCWGVPWPIGRGQTIRRLGADHPSGVCFCQWYNLINMIVPVSCMWSRSCARGCPGPARCHVIHRYISDHPAGYCSVSVSVHTCIPSTDHDQNLYISRDLNVVFNVPVDALASWGQAICRHSIGHLRNMRSHCSCKPLFI